MFDSKDQVIKNLKRIFGTLSPIKVSLNGKNLALQNFLPYTLHNVVLYAKVDGKEVKISTLESLRIFILIQQGDTMNNANNPNNANQANKEHHAHNAHNVNPAKDNPHKDSSKPAELNEQALLKRLDEFGQLDAKEQRLRAQIEKLNAQIKSTTIAYEKKIKGITLAYEKMHSKQLLKAKTLCDELDNLQKRRG